MKHMATHAWFFAVVVAGAMGCSSRTTGGQSNEPNQGAGHGGTSNRTPLGGGTAGSGKVAGGGVAGGGSLTSGGAAGVGATSAGGTAAGGTAAGGGAANRGGSADVDCLETHFSCHASVTIPILSLPDGTLTACVGTACLEQAVAGGQVAGGSVELIGGDKLHASWNESQSGPFVPATCFDSADESVSFKSPHGTVVPLFSGQIPLVLLNMPGCMLVREGTVVLQQPIDIAALVQAAEEGGAGGDGGGGGVGNEAGGGSGGAP
jgi:hypothetical protein